MKNWISKNSTHFIVAGIFLLLVFFYFTPIFQGKGLVQHDVIQAEASQKELFEYKAKDGKTPLWTNSMFGGMPTYQIWNGHESNLISYVGRFLKTVFPPPMDIILLCLFGAYLLFSVLKIRPWLAVLGAVALTFSSYNFIYIEAGHLTKMYAIAYLAPIIAFVILTFRGNRTWAPLLLTLFLALEIRANHLQMTYYLFIVLVLYVLFELYHAIKSKQIKDFGIAVGLQTGAVVLAVLINATVLFPTYEYSKLTTRGQANLPKTEESSESYGLDRSYAYDWSQGVGETITFLIPNAYGGKSQGVLDEKSEVVQFFVKHGYPQYQAVQIAQNLPAYWGEKPLTSGPWYFGAAVFALFILGLLIVPGRLKWWLASATALILLLSFGRHFPLISDLFFDYVPMYNKFRAVESTLVIASILIPILAVLAVDELFKLAPDYKDVEKKILYTFGGVAVFCLLIGVMPDLFLSFRGSNHQAFTQSLGQQMGNEAIGQELGAALIKDRKSLASKDAYRSFFIVVLAFGILWSYMKGKTSPTVFLVLLTVLVTVDLWTVDKRYLNDDTFVDKRQIRQRVKPTEVDELIMRDKSLSYRILDLTSNPFSDASPSLFHKNLGGYHAAKLMRFQEIIEHQFNGALNEDVLDMFNTKYIISLNSQNNAETVNNRSSAAGNAWYVDRVTFVKDNKEEMRSLDSFDPTKEAFVHQEFKDKIDENKISRPSQAEIELVSYHPDTLRYESSADDMGFVVFSEMYYDKGWKAFIDGEEVPIIRADYALRALQVPEGDHKIEFVFAPKSMKVSMLLSLVSSVLLVGLLIFYVVFRFWRSKA